MNMSRRQLLKQFSLIATGSIILPGCTQQSNELLTALLTSSSNLTPDEAAPHTATWMAYGATARAWGTSGAYGATRIYARQDLMRIAVNISRFEAANMLVSSADMTQAVQLLNQAKIEANNGSNVYSGGASLPAIESGGKIQLLTRTIDDLWIRDTGPVFVKNTQGQLNGVNFNFNGWGQANTGAVGWKKDPIKAANGIVDQPISNDKLVADFVLQKANAQKISTWLVMEGGGIEVDGEGTAICTESCILNPNRNPGRSKIEVETELNRILGIQKVIWLPGIKAIDITDGHIDFYARFVAPGKVVYGLDNDTASGEYATTHENKRLLEQATDAQGRKLSLSPLYAPDFLTVRSNVIRRNAWRSSTFINEGFAAGYIGFYAMKNAILMQQFGDSNADKAAFDAIQSLYPTRTIMQITSDGIANGGGTVHCTTQQQIKI